MSRSRSRERGTARPEPRPQRRGRLGKLLLVLGLLLLGVYVYGSFRTYGRVVSPTGKEGLALLRAEGSRLRAVSVETWSTLESELAASFSEREIATDRLLDEAGDAWSHTRGWVRRFHRSDPDESPESGGTEPVPPAGDGREGGDASPSDRESAGSGEEPSSREADPSTGTAPTREPVDPPPAPRRDSSPPARPEPIREPDPVETDREIEAAFEAMPPDLAEAIEHHRRGMEHYANSTSQNPRWRTEVVAAAEDFRTARAHLRRFREEHPDRAKETDPLMREINRFLFSAIKRSPPRY